MIPAPTKSMPPVPIQPPNRTTCRFVMKYPQTTELLIQYQSERDYVLTCLLASNFFRCLGREVNSKELYRVGRHQSSLPRAFRVVYRYRRRCREERRQRGPYRALDRQKAWGRPALSRPREDMKVNMSHLANRFQGKGMVEYRAFLTNRPGRYTRRSI